jgi:teichuronic acid biosynthesis glycosyltransferase TuaG
MKYSVVIPTYNHCDDFLKPCIESIIKYTDLQDIELIISANGCSDNTSQYIDELRMFFNSLNISKNLQIAWSDKPLGYPKATNEGIKLATTNKIVLLNNDCLLLEQEKNTWLKLLEQPFSQDENCGITSVVKDYNKTIKKDYAIFFCVMIDSKLFKEIGLLNEEYETGSGEDIEFCYLAQEKSYKIYQALDTELKGDKFTGTFPIYHLGEGTVHDQSLVDNWKTIFLKNSFKNAKKYNIDWSKNKQKSDKKIAVITPVHNDIEKMFDCINSVKKQSIDNICHYIFDDGSVDNLSDAMQELTDDPCIKYFNSKENLGQSKSRNFLIQESIKDGFEYLAFLDSDDTWMQNHLEKSLLHLTENDIVYSTPIFLDEKGQRQYPFNIPVPQIFVGKQLLHNNYIWISSVVAKTECFKNNSFDPLLDSIEDWEMWIQLWKKEYKFYKKDDVTTTYLVKDNSQASIGSTKYDLLRQKHSLLPRLKLHLACGHDYNEDYINVDLYAPDDAKTDLRFDVMQLPYDDNSVDEIKAFHVIEHFDFYQIQQVLKEWHRVLKPGGRLWLETPDFLESCRTFVNADEDFKILLYNHFFAHPWIPGQTHKFLFTETQLTTNLSWAGFKNMRRLPPASNYVRPDTYQLFLNMESFK